MHVGFLRWLNKHKEKMEWHQLHYLCKLLWGGGERGGWSRGEEGEWGGKQPKSWRKKSAFKKVYLYFVKLRVFVILRAADPHWLQALYFLIFLLSKYLFVTTNQYLEQVQGHSQTGSCWDWGKCFSPRTWPCPGEAQQGDLTLLCHLSNCHRVYFAIYLVPCSSHSCAFCRWFCCFKWP